MLLELKAIIADPIAAHSELTRLRAANEELRKALSVVVETWRGQCGRVFESMGSGNPQAKVIDEAVERAAELLKKKV